MRTPASHPLFLIILAAVVAAGILIGWMDTRPTWDDTGITVTAILAATFIPGILYPSRAWLWALLVGCAVALFNLIPDGHTGGLVAIPISVCSAYAGVFIRKIIRPGQ
jgi:hypothetical protein